MKITNSNKKSVWGFGCWNCDTNLDIEDVLFKNVCSVCGASQKNNKEDSWRW